MNYYQKILIGIFSISLAVIPEAIITSAKEYQIVQSLSSQQISLRAKQVTVRIDGDNFGSGIIVDSSDNAYTILTNWHVVKDSANYVVQTVDGRQHQVQPDTIKQLSNLDLAILQFTSQQNYQVAEIGDSNNLIEGQNVYFAGYPGELRSESDRFYRFFAANLVGLLATPNANGYSLIYDGGAFPGMSGGPVFNAQGLLIGIHGETNIHAVTGAVSNYGIPSNTYQAALANINSNNSSSETTQSESETNSNAAITATNPAPSSSAQETVATPEAVVETNTTPLTTPDNSNPETAKSESETNSNATVTATNPAPSSSNQETTATPEAAVETNTTPLTTPDNSNSETAKSESETNSNAAVTATNPAPSSSNQETAATPEAVVETNTTPLTTTKTNSSESNSVPVFSSPQNQEQNSQAVTSNNIEKPEANVETPITTDFPKITSESVVNLPDEQINNLVNNITIPHNQENSNQANSSPGRQITLISPDTGIDYTNLQTLLAQKKWLEADRHTKKAISNVFQTIKRKSNTDTIELRTLADRACNDIYTIDVLWRKFSGDRFGFRIQQDLWNNLNQNNDFSIQVWRSFATEIGWKKGDINNAQGYILYEKLTFNNQTAPQGHLPWWFDYSIEQKNAMRQILTRCNLQDTAMKHND